MNDRLLHLRHRGARRARSLGAAVLALGLCTLSACAPPSLRELARSAGGAVEAAIAMKPSPDTSQSALLAFLAAAEDGEVQDVDDAATGAARRVRAGRLYHAASGQVCRRFTANSTSTPDASEEGLACRDASGRWTRARLLSPASP